MQKQGTVTYLQLKKNVEVATNKIKADLVFKNAKYVNVFTEKIEYGDIAVCDGYIVGIGNDKIAYEGNVEIDCKNKIVCPALLDSHVHLESAMVSPKSFRDLVVPHGTCAVVADPHEITNVAGIDGINYILDMSKDLDLKVCVMVPSCVPSTPLDEAGAVLNAKDIKFLYNDERILGLAEMMNAFGVTHGDCECLTKCADALNSNKLIDGHAPSLSGNNLNAYLVANISTDHECSNFEEAIEKLMRGQWIEVREGTVCKDLEALIKLFNDPYCDRCMLATDDNHPDTIIELGHIDKIIRKAISLGADPVKAIKMGSLNTAMHYNLRNYGAIGVGYKANVIVLNDLNKFEIDSVYLNGNKVSEKNKVLKRVSSENNTLDPHRFGRVYKSFNLDDVYKDNFAINKKGKNLRALELVKDGVLTNEVVLPLVEKENLPYGVDLDRDIVKIAVVERHHNSHHIGVGFIKDYGLKKGAIASSIGHDSHNIIVVGANDEDMALAVNTIKNNNGGIAITLDNIVLGSLKLEVAGLMTENDEDYVIKTLDNLKNIAYNELSVNKDHDPFMTLAFMQLPVIPELKIIPKGLVRVSEQIIVDAIFD